MCPSNGHEVCIRPSPISRQGLAITSDYGLDVAYIILVPRASDCRRHLGKYFNGKRKLGMRDPEFINHVNGTMVCLTCAILCHQLGAYRLGVYQDPPDFKPTAVGCRRPSMSPPSLVCILKTNQSCQTFSSARRTPGGQYDGQHSNSCSGICVKQSQKGSSKIIV